MADAIVELVQRYFSGEFMDEKRTCRHCGEEKPLPEMYVHRPRSTNGERLGDVISSWCITCRNAAMKSRPRK